MLLWDLRLVKSLITGEPDLASIVLGRYTLSQANSIYTRIKENTALMFRQRAAFSLKEIPAFSSDGQQSTGRIRHTYRSSSGLWTLIQIHDCIWIMKKLVSREEYEKMVQTYPLGYCPFCDLDKQIILGQTRLWCWIANISPLRRISGTPG